MSDTGVWAVVLAAGESSRFGSPKQRLLLEPVLERVRKSRVDDLLVVLGAHAVETSARTVRCPGWTRGPGASLRCGFDGPDLAPEAIDRVIARWQAGDQPVVAATYAGTRLHPVLIAREAWPLVPDEGAKDLDAVLVPCDDLEPPGDVDFTTDVPDRLKS